MANLIYTGITSLDGYTVDADGGVDWSAPDEEVHAFVNDLERGIGTYLYGRRLYETMVYWENLPLDDARPIVRDFAELWRAADKIVFSRSLSAVASENTVIEPEFDPAAISALKSTSRAPLSVGGGTPYFPKNVRFDLDLVDEQRFAGGVVRLHYGTRA
jgi:dihydrofolate reductase